MPGATALRALNDNPPDLGVFDIKMPGMDGMELLRRVREFSSMPVIFLTSKDDELDEALGLAMGADDYISKPFSQRLLIARVRAILRRQDLARGEAVAGNEDEQQLIEFPFMIGQYVAIAYVQNSLRVPLADYNPGLSSRP